MEQDNNLAEKIENLLEENLRLTQDIHVMTKKIKNYVTFQKVLSIFYLLIFVIPLVLSIIYIPIFIREYLGPVQELLDDGQNISGFNNTGDILNQAQKIINDNK